MSEKEEKKLTDKEAVLVGAEIAAMLKEKTNDGDQIALILNTAAGLLFNSNYRLTYSGL